MKGNKPALIIIDIINDFQFQHGEELSKQTANIAKKIHRLKRYMHQNNHPVIYVNDHYQLWQADLKKILEKCINPLSQPILSLLQPEDDDYFLIKPKHSIFYGTALNMLLDELQVDTLILTGIAGNICVLFSANDAYMREYNLIVPSDCIASNIPEDNDFALKMMKNVLQANTVEHTHHIRKVTVNENSLFSPTDS
ncbi:isochorismatase family cysteine hydrolase [Priestia abyssalis]|uniref:isochorismatase family cysteine hydrolase n=1 Tax=Priestia abyssalis TaxID=1221450 RepID=UPI00099496DB|nr:isochorismatase family cysteine hydrolase [Priestia abyssalis]